MIPRSYVIYASVPWSGHWQTEHNLAHALAARHPVLYVDPQLSPMSPFRYGLSDASRRQLADIVRRGVRPSGRLQVFSPLALPPLTDPRMQRASLPLLRAQIRRAIARAGLRSPVVVSCRSLSELVGVAGEVLRVGIVMDDLASGAALVNRNSADLAREVAATCAAADVLCVPSQPLQDLLAKDGWSSALLPWGFAQDLARAYDTASEPGEYGALPRPLLGYTGSIDDRLDYDLIARLADRFRHGSIVFVGPVSPRLSASARALLSSRENIHLLGVRRREALPGYIAHLDCALLPYAETEFTRCQSPLKLWDYLYAGPPLVATGSADLRRFKPPLLHFADTAATALDLVARALAAGRAGSGERKAFALANSWDARAAQLDAIVDDALLGPGRLRAAA